MSGKPIVVKNGRFGPYVTDGETNASLRAATIVETLDLDGALELLAERAREAGPPKKRAQTRPIETFPSVDKFDAGSAGVVRDCGTHARTESASQRSTEGCDSSARSPGKRRKNPVRCEDQNLRE